jgi:hypothetical protein
MRASLRTVPTTIASIALLGCGGGGSGDPDAVPTPACEPSAGATFEPDDSVGTKVNVHAVFAGGAAWLTYDVVEGDTSNLDVAMVRVGCDGATLSQGLVTSRAGNNDTSAPLATAGERVLVTWAADKGPVTDNLDIFTRAFALDGTPAGDDAVLAHELGDFPAMVADWMPGVAGDSDDDGFVVVGTRAHPEVERFATFITRTDAAGAADGATLEPSLVPMANHNFPAAATTSAGTLVAYLDGPDTGDDHVVWTLLAAGADTLAPSPPSQVVELPAAGAPPALAGLGDHGYAVVNTDSNGGADGGSAQLWVRRLPGGAPADAVEIAPGTAANYYPAVATDGVSGGAVAWLRFGATRELWLARFVDDGGAITASAPVQVTTERSVSAYKPAIVHLAGDHFLVAWHEYDGTNYRLLAQIVELPA